MRRVSSHIDGLTQLHRLQDKLARLGTWRQSVAALAADAVDLRPVPLEGLDPSALCASIRVALADGLVDDLGWLSPPHAAAALYELASALPIGEERRELGRRVLVRLHEGNAETFVILATQLAKGSRRGLSGAPIRARVALALTLPIGASARSDALALSLISRPDLARDWLLLPSTGSLPARRLAARLLERAAREAVRRRARNDPNVLAVFELPAVLSAWNRLLADRESLVWRHVAVARGVLSREIPHFAERIDQDLDPSSTPTQWRRAAASLAARIAVEPEDSLARSFDLVRGELMQRDPGLAAAMVFGIPRTAEAEPDAAERLLDALVQVGNLDTIEAFVDLRHELVGTQVGQSAAATARSRLAQTHFASSDDDGRAALLASLEQELGDQPHAARRPGLRDGLSHALVAFAERDARSAFADAIALLNAVADVVDDLESSDDSSPSGRRMAFLALRELDRALFESSTLSDLLMLGSSSAESAALRSVQDFHERVAAWILRQEADAIGPGEVDHLTLRARRLRTLLHLVDAETCAADEQGQHARERMVRTTRLLIARARDDVSSPLRRVVCAAAARSCDALLRAEMVDLSDLLVLVAIHVRDPQNLLTIAEASMDPATETAFRAHANLVRQATKAARMTGQRARVGLESLGALIRALPAVASPRVDALREALTDFADATQTVLAARSLVELVGEGESSASRIATLADAVALLARLIAGARRRFGDLHGEHAARAEEMLRAVDIGMAQSVRDGSDVLRMAAEAALDPVRDELPPSWADIVADALLHLARLPVVASEDRASAFPSLRPAHREAPLPPWLPPSRVIGGFYIIRPLGSGAVASVFAACRVDEKALRRPMRFALKVPEYGGDVARSLSEAEFLRMFREEAGALLAVPDHPNLARLVTFDAGARPKPVLVMELVEGPTLQWLIDTSALDIDQAFDLLDGVAAGLEAMHSAGVGHLDLKPSNVILRDPDASPVSMDFLAPPVAPRSSQLPGRTAGVPVLVDFGLAGRTVRPGCATVQYGAPEVWGHVPEGFQPRPSHVDTYAFGCLAYEVLTGNELFEGPTQMAVMTNHLRYDGDCPALQTLDRNEDLAPLARAIRAAVRRDPRQRAPLGEVRDMLRAAAHPLRGAPWPVRPSAFSRRPPSPLGSHPPPLPLVKKKKQ